MMEGRCATCRWWWKAEGRKGRDWRYCALTDTEDGAIYPESLALVDGWEGGVLRTLPDFGCVQWRQGDPDASSTIGAEDGA